MSQLQEFIQDVPFLSDLEKNEMLQVIPLFGERKYNKGSIIFLEHDQGEELFIIKSGCIKVFQIEEVKEMILAIFRKGDYFGEMALVEEEQVRSATAEAMEPTVLYVLQRKDLMNLLQAAPQITLKLLQVAWARLRQSNELIKDLTTLDSRSRIIKMILNLSDKYGKPMADGIWIDLKLTHQQLADMTGTVRETVTKTLLELQNEHYITIKQKHIFINNRLALMNKLEMVHVS